MKIARYYLKARGYRCAAAEKYNICTRQTLPQHKEIKMKTKIFAAAAVLAMSISSGYAAGYSPFSQASLEDANKGGMPYDLTQPKPDNPNSLSGMRIGILAAPGVETEEIVFPYDFLKARGARVDIVVPSWVGKRVVVLDFVRPVLVAQGDKTFAEAAKENYDMLIIAGGVLNSQVLRTDGDAIALIKAQARKRHHFVASVCSGGQVLISAGLAKGKRLTASDPVKQDLINAGANFTGNPAEIDGNLVTGKDPSAMREFMMAIEEVLAGTEKVSGDSIGVPEVPLRKASRVRFE